MTFNRFEIEVKGFTFQFSAMSKIFNRFRVKKKKKDIYQIPAFFYYVSQEKDSLILHLKTTKRSRCAQVRVYS